MNPDVFRARLHALRASKEDTVKNLVRLDDDPTLDKNARLKKVFQALYNAIVAVKGMIIHNFLCLILHCKSGFDSIRFRENTVRSSRSWFPSSDFIILTYFHGSESDSDQT